MALRGSVTRRSLGSPMVGLLRDMDRRTRTTTRRAGPPRPPQADTPAAPRPAPAPARLAPVVAVLESGSDGRARWTFPAAFDRPPVLTVLPVDPTPNDDTGTVLAALEDVTAAGATVRAWRTRPLRQSGVVAPAGPGVRLHVTATPAPG